MSKCIDFGALTRQVLASGYSTYRLGRELGLSQPSVSRLATGRTKSISAVAGVRLIYLAGGEVRLPIESEAGSALTA